LFWLWSWRSAVTSPPFAERSSVVFLLALAERCYISAFGGALLHLRLWRSAASPIVEPMSVSEAFRAQAEACGSLGSPFMQQLCTLLADREWPDGAIKDRVYSWEGDITPRSASVPLRLCGGLHALHLNGHRALTPVYPPATADDDALWSAISTVLLTEEHHLDRWLDSPPQTNEVRRSVTLVPVGHVLAERYRLPIRVSELGASAGLNLNWDRFGLQIDGGTLGAPDPVLTLTPNWVGPVPPTTQPHVVSKAGVDINPLDPTNPIDVERLYAYLWADQAHRVALTKAAIDAGPPPVDKADAIDWLDDRLDHIPGQLHLIYSTVAWQYFPEESRSRGTSIIEGAGAKATNDSPLAWFRMEAGGDGPGAHLTLRLWPGDLAIDLGRADFHGRWVEWKGES